MANTHADFVPMLLLFADFKRVFAEAFPGCQLLSFNAPVVPGKAYATCKFPDSWPGDITSTWLHLPTDPPTIAQVLQCDTSFNISGTLSYLTLRIYHKQERSKTSSAFDELTAQLRQRFAEQVEHTKDKWSGSDEAHIRACREGVIEVQFTDRALYSFAHFLFADLRTERGS